MCRPSVSMCMHYTLFIALIAPIPIINVNVLRISNPYSYVIARTQVRFLSPISQKLSTLEKILLIDFFDMLSSADANIALNTDKLIEIQREA